VYIVQYNLNARGQPLQHVANSYEGDPEAAKTIDLEAVIMGARRQSKVIASCVALSLLLALLYCIFATRWYTGTTTVLVDVKMLGISNPANQQDPLILTDTSTDSQLEVIKSQKIALSVINKTGLYDDPEFMGPSFFSGLMRFMKVQIPEEERAVKEAQVLSSFEDRTIVTRTNKTFALQIEFLSKNPKKAATIANAIAVAYIFDEIDAKQAAAATVSEWLSARILELKQKAAEAELNVAQYRENNSLITAGGQLINDKQLTEVTTQLGDARADVGRTQARYDHILTTIAKRDTGATASEELSSPVITNLRNLYFDVAKRKNDLSQRVGANHFQILNAERQMQVYENEIFEELGRIAESARSDVEVAKQRERSLSENLTRLLGSNANDNRMAVDLRQRQQVADAYQSLYEKSLERFQDLLRQQTFSMSETRVIEEALPPVAPSVPKPILLLAIGLLGGLVIGTGAGIYREYADRTFRRTSQIRSELNLDTLGVLPLQLPVKVDADASSGASNDPQVLPGIPPKLKICAMFPFSQHADTMGAIKVEIDIACDAGAPNVIGVVSSVEGEGKSFTSANIAVFCALTGASTLLIDADLRNCSLSRELAPAAVLSLAAVIRGKAQIIDAVKQLSEGLWFLPAGKAHESVNPSELLRCGGMKNLLEAATDMFDYIFVDLPPLLPVVDGHAIEPLMSHFVYVVEWGRISREIVRKILSENPSVHKKCLGAVLNKVDQNVIGQYSENDAYVYRSYT
jgi:polysaccharide biosynthesis transport protein